MSHNDREIPTAAARLVKTEDVWLWVVDRCPYCGKRHSHGGGPIEADPHEFMGHRVSHCVDRKHNAGYMLEELSKPTWSKLVEAEPKLAVLMADARAVKDEGGSSFCANAIWYARGGLKQRLCELVGWNRKGDPILGTQEAYDLAYKKVYNALPDCRNCQCW